MSNKKYFSVNKSNQSKATKPILAFYGIQDCYPHLYPDYTHDHNLTVLVNGEIEQYIHLERYTKRKSDNNLHLFLEELVDEQLGLKGEFDLVSVNSFVGSSFISKTGRIRVEPITQPLVTNKAQKANGMFQGHPFKGFDPSKNIESNGSIVSHELAHVFSCLPFFGEFKDNSLLIHFDGAASQSNFSAFHYKDGQVKVIEYHWDLLHLSRIYNNNALAFALMKAERGESNSVPGKLMGYAARGTANEDLEQWLMTNNYFKDSWDDYQPFYKQAAEFGWNGDLANNDDSFLMDVAASLQSIFHKGVVNKMQQLQEQTKADYLYYTGGCALNIGANSKIIESNLFKEIFIPPACNDSGLSLGAAAFVNWTNNQSIQQHSPYLNYLKDNNPVDTSNETIKEVAKRIMQGEVLATCNGYGEAGPRALGNRSIIARVDKVAVAEKVSMECKGREWFRPIAPVMLERNTKRVTGFTHINHLSRYMLLDFKILDAYKDSLAGVVHTNGTARIQTIFNRAENPFLYDLLDYLDRQYNMLGLINTSFNRKGNPIVHTREDAQKAAKELKLDGLIINGKFESLK